MFTTHTHLFVHMNKTGGTFLHRYAKRACPETRSIDNHKPLWSAKQHDIAGRVVVGLVREPLSWYASWLHYHRVSAREDRVPVPDIAAIASNAFANPHEKIRRKYRKARPEWQVSPYVYRIIFFFCPEAMRLLGTKNGYDDLLSGWSRWIGVAEWIHTETLLNDFHHITGAPRVSADGCNRNAHSHQGPETYRQYIPLWAQEQDAMVAKRLGYSGDTQ